MMTKEADPQPGSSADDEAEATSSSSSSATRPSLLVNLRQLWDSVRMSIFVIGSGIILFAAARNTITWHLQWCWGASGNYWQRRWVDIYSFFGTEERVGIWGTFLVTGTVFWTINALLTCLDLFGTPSFLVKYKIQEDKNNPLEPEQWKKAVKLCFFNQNVVGLPFLVITYYLMRLRGCNFGPELPYFEWILFEMIVFILVEEVCFYYSHRLMHHPRLYKRIHKIHHEWTAPIGMIGIYAHPIEHIVSNMLGPMLGPLLMGSHIATTWMWFCLALVSTSIAHCGYHIPFLPSPEAHDYHHLKFNNNFGTLGVLDRLHGTDANFRASKQYQRHIFSTSLTPVKQLVEEQNPPKCKNGKPEEPTATTQTTH